MKLLARRTFGSLWRSLVICVLILCLVTTFWMVFKTLTEGNLPLPPSFGNFDRVVNMLTKKPAPDKFSFAVVGDTRSFGTFEGIMEILKRKPLDFLVLLGDCTQRPFPGDHRFFRAEIATEMATPYPTFYLPGNHDVRPGHFDMKQFVQFYGPTQFYFLYGNSLFIFLRVLPEKYYSPQAMEEDLAFLEKVLQAERQKAKRVFVFQHTPPPLSDELSFKDIIRPDKLLELFDRFQVNYVITGDYHGYARFQRKNTDYIVSGGGGAHLHYSEYGTFHHAVVLTVSPDNITEEIVWVPRVHHVEDMLEYFAMARLWPWMEQHRFLAGLALAVMLFSTGGMVWELRRYWKAE